MEVVRVVFGIVWRFDNACGATALCRTNCRVHQLPESRSIGQVVSTGPVNVTLATAAAASASVVVNVILEVAVQGSRESAGLARSGKDWEGADRTW